MKASSQYCSVHSGISKATLTLPGFLEAFAFRPALKYRSAAERREKSVRIQTWLYKSSSFDKAAGFRESSLATIAWYRNFSHIASGPNCEAVIITRGIKFNKKDNFRITFILSLLSVAIEKVVRIFARSCKWSAYSWYIYWQLPQFQASLSLLVIFLRFLF